MKDATLAALFGRYRTHGDGRALAAVFDRTAKELLELACHLVRDPSEAEDLVQATFVAAIQRRASYDARAPLQAWLYGILWREAAKARRRAARAIDPRRLHERDEPDPLGHLAGSEVPEAVSAALAKLPAHYREVLEPMLLHEQRPEHIARALARSPGTVRSQIHRGLEELRRALAPRFAAPALLALPTRGLTNLRGEVLRAAGFAPATVAAGSVAAVGWTIGGALASKVALVGFAAVAVALAATWVAVRPSEAVRGGLDEERALATQVDERANERARPAPGPEAGERSAEEPTRASSPAPAAVESFGETLAYWLARYAERPDDWRHGLAVTNELATLPPDEALALLSAAWPHLSVPVKEQALKPFVFDGGHVHALKVLHLAATDATLSVQARAFGYLKDYAFRDFALDYDAYLRWAAANRERPVGEVLSESARTLVAEMLAASPAQRAERLLGLRELDLRAGTPAGVDLASVLRDAGALRMVEVALADLSEGVPELALRWSKSLQAPEAWLQAWVVPLIERPDQGPELVSAALDALARKDCGWAQGVLLGHLERSTAEQVGSAYCAARALAEIGDLTVLPRLIGILLRARTGELDYAVGYYGLAKLTGVTWQESYDGAWWLDWWEKNRGRFPAEVAAMEVGR